MRARRLPLLLAVLALSALAGCATPKAGPEARPDELPAEQAGPWTAEELLRAALGLPEPPADEARELMEQAAPWALQPAEPAPTERASYHRHHGVVEAGTGLGYVVLVSEWSESGPANGLVHSVEATLAMEGVAGTAWRLCVWRDGEAVPEVPCVEGEAPLAIHWAVPVDDASRLPAGHYGVTYDPVGPVKAAVEVDVRFEVRWMGA